MSDVSDMMAPKKIWTYELDSFLELNPDPSCSIITEESFEHSSAIRKKLNNPDIHIYFAPYTDSEETIEKSTSHKVSIIDMLKKIGYEHMGHYENSVVNTIYLENAGISVI